MSKIKKPRLGRGLESLISVPVVAHPGNSSNSDVIQEADALMSEGLSADVPPQSAHPHQLVWIDVDAIHPNPFQPRKHFDEKGINELARSIEQDGLMQPVVVRLAQDGVGYQIVAGERRWRAAKKVGLKSIPAILKALDERQMAEWALIENLQRKDLGILEKAEAFARLVDRFGLTHHEIAERVGVERSTISNTLRLLDLSSSIQDMIRSDLLTPGHARAVLSLSDDSAREALARKIVKESLSVRQAEALAQAESPEQGSQPISDRGGKTAGPAHLSDVQKQIEQQLGTRVILKPGKKKGSGVLQIHFFDLDQFDALIQRLGVQIE